MKAAVSAKGGDSAMKILAVISLTVAACAPEGQPATGAEVSRLTVARGRPGVDGPVMPGRPDAAGGRPDGRGPGGACTGPMALDCDDGNPCTDDSCEPGLGCQHRDNSGPCDDGDLCTRLDTCQQGVCVGANAIVCTALDACHVAGVCDRATGACSHPPAPDGSSCDDGDACTRADSCQAGACVGSQPVTCQAAGVCRASGTCDPASGLCSDPPAPDGSSCDDGDRCTSGDVCRAGACQPGVAPDCAAGQLTSISPMSVSRFGHAAVHARANRLLLVAGGLDELGRTLDTVEAFDESTGAWRSLAPLPTPRHGATATSLAVSKSADTILFAGGSADGVAVATADILDVASGTWRSLPPMPRAAFGHRAVATSFGRAFLTGGGLGRGVHYVPSNLHEEERWVELTMGPLPRASDGFTLTYDGARIYLIGGQDSEVLSDVWRLSPTAQPTFDQWSPLPSLAAPRRLHTATLLAGHRIFVAGGESQPGLALTSTEIYDPALARWSPGPSLSVGRAGAAAMVLTDGRVLVAGGTRERTLSADLIDLETGTVQRLSSPVPAQASASADLLPSGALALTGGFALAPFGVTSAAAIVRPPATSCESPGTCQPETGLCGPPTASSEGQSCSDANPCTSGETCRSGRCQGGTPVVCGPPGQCHTGYCDVNGGCVTVPVADGTACTTPADVCLDGGTCQSGVCVPNPSPGRSAELRLGLLVAPDDGSLPSLQAGLRALGYDPRVYTSEDVAAGALARDAISVLVAARFVTTRPLEPAAAPAIRAFIKNGGGYLGEYDGAGLVFNSWSGSNYIIDFLSASPLAMAAGHVTGGGVLLPVEFSRFHVADPTDPLMLGLPPSFLDGAKAAMAITGHAADRWRAPASFTSSGYAGLVPPGTFPAVLAGSCLGGRLVLYTMSLLSSLHDPAMGQLVRNSIGWLAAGE